jgi:hypothetical protein
VTTTASTAAAATAAVRRSLEIFIIAALADLTSECKRGKQAANLLAMAFHAHHIIRVLMAHQQFKL